MPASNPFHPGEIRAQNRAGASDVSQWAADFIRPFMPDQHRDFFANLPFLVIAGSDAEGRHWVTLVDGPDGFVSSPNATTLAVDTAPDAQDPLSNTFSSGGDVGLLGIELATRRRNRMNGKVRPDGSMLMIDVVQSFGNCPQYIHERNWHRNGLSRPREAIRSAALSDSQASLIRAADTMFIGTGQSQRGQHASNGFDASHRGGEPGFVAVTDATHLRIPDYAGNNFFNTIGNLLENPRIGLVFVDFETGGLLHITGTARIDWDASGSHDPSAKRMIEVTIDAVVERPAALALRWSKDDADLRELVVVDKVEESEAITSFHLASRNRSPLPPFESGQHLPIEIDVPGQSGRVRRTYSLSGAPDADTYRISVKREREGLASRFMHHALAIGDHIHARPAAGDFVIPCSQCPLVLVSAGVGLTPMLAMLHAVAAERGKRPVWFVHGARHGAAHAMQAEVQQLIASNPNFRSKIYYSRPRSEDRHGVAFDALGRIDAAKLGALDAGPSAHYMLCGPASFIATIRAGLEHDGVISDRIHYETFGPGA